MPSWLDVSRGYLCCCFWKTLWGSSYLLTYSGCLGACLNSSNCEASFDLLVYVNTSLDFLLSLILSVVSLVFADLLRGDEY